MLKRRLSLYIPKCIYFYFPSRFQPQNHIPLYIPKCIYFYGVVVMDAHDFVRIFTFQNVSISTLTTRVYVPIMKLYIPKCIYFYNVSDDSEFETDDNFTFQNVSISTQALG